MTRTQLYPTAVCSKCGGTYDRAAFFRARELNAFSSSMQRHGTCIGCELTARTKAKEANRILVKATGARSRHAARLSLKHTGQIMTGDEFGEAFGWHIQRMVDDIERAEQGCCHYCERPFAEMPGELSAISIDVIDSSRKPFYRTNTVWCCATCNSEKSHTDPELWERKLLSWRLWNARQKMPPPALGLLF